MRLHLPAQAALVARAAAHSGAFCRSAALRHPSAVAAASVARRWLHAGAELALGPFEPLSGGSQQQAAGGAEEARACSVQEVQQCSAVLLVLSLALGFALPTALLLVWEGRLRAVHPQRSRQRRHGCEAAQGGLPPGSANTSLLQPAGPLTCREPRSATPPPADGSEQDTTAVAAQHTQRSAAQLQQFTSLLPAPAAPTPLASIAAQPRPQFAAAAGRSREPDQQPTNSWYCALYRLLADPADPWPRWLAATAAAVACWQAALCLSAWASRL